MSPHLTDEQLHDLLTDTHEAPSAPALAHVAACTHCQEELATLKHSLLNLRLATLNLSLLHTPPRPAVGATIHRSFFAAPRFIWAAGLACVLAVSAASVSTLHKSASPQTSNAAVSPNAQPVSDEALLQDIDSDLSTSVPPSLQPLDTAPAASEQTPTSNSN